MPSRGQANPRRGISVSSRWGWGPIASAERLRPCRAEDKQIRSEASASVRDGGGAPSPVQSACGHAERRTSRSEARHQRQFAMGVGPHRQCRAPAAMPSRGRANPKRGISVSSRWGWGPIASAERLRPCRAEDKQIRGEASASVRDGGGAPSPVQSACGHAEPRTSKSEARHQRQFAMGVGPHRQCGAPAAMPSRGQADPKRGISVSSRWGWGPIASA